MPVPLRVLILEDHPADAELMLRELRQAGFAPDWQVVYAEADYLAHLHPDLDLILSDYAMPQFNALRALRLLQARGWDVPFVVVTGTISEEAAVECMLEGAADYLLKDRLARLGPAVTRALQAKRLRDEKRGAETALRESEARYRLISELTSDYAYAFQVQSDGELTLERVSGAFERITGYTSEEVDARGGWASLVHPDDRLLVRRRVQVLVSGRPDVSEFRIVTRTGEVRWLHDYGRPEWDDAQRRVVRFYGAVQDITERKRAEEALAHYAAETAVLYRASAQLLQSGGVAGLAEQIARAVTQEFNLCDCGVLLVVERENGPELTQTARTGDFQVPLNADLSLGGPGLMPAAVHAGKMLYAPDAPTDPRYIALDHRTRSELVVPLRVGGRILGVLDLQSPEPDAFPERMRRMVAAFAERAALA
ncbi:MAG: PAS domain S-box protein, partial [Anaerolineales bacterium]